MLKLYKRFLNALPLISIFILALFLRFYNLNKVYVFGADEEYQATYAMTLVRHLHLIWIGVNVAHTGAFLGPFWTYFTAFWLYLSNGNPLLTAYVAAFLGVLTTLLLYVVTGSLFNKKVAFLTAFLYASLPLIVYYDQKYWNPTTIPLLSILLFYSIYKMFDNPKWMIVFSIGFGLVFHVHLSLLPIGIIGFITIIINKHKIEPKIILLSILAFLIIYSPLLVFDANHGWTNITTIFRIKQIVNFDDSSKIDPVFHSKTFIDTLGRIWFLKSGGSSSDEVLFACSDLSSKDINPNIRYSSRTYSSILPILISVISLVLFISNKHINIRLKILITACIAGIAIPFLFFPGGAFEYYLLGLFPFIIIIFASNILYKNIFIKVLVYLISVALAIFGINTVIHNNDKYGLLQKINLIEETSSYLSDKKYELFESGGCHAYEGMRYLFSIYGKRPDRSSGVDSHLGWLYPDQIYMGPLDYKIIIHEDRIPYSNIEKNIAKFSSQGFTIYIFDWKK